MKETNIEKIVRKNTPDFVIGTSYYINKYHSYKLWNCPVHFKDNNFVQKSFTDKNGITSLKKYNIAMPDFVLNNKQQMQTLKNVLYNADNGLPYNNPFLRKNGWYIEVFGDYWHNKEVIGLPREIHEKQVKDAYEASGNHVLILWENDILNHWQEYCLSKLNQYFADFAKENEVSFEKELVEAKSLSDLSLQCLNDTIVYRKLNVEDKEYVLNDIINRYQTLKPLYDKNGMQYDWIKFKEKCQNNNFKQISSVGNSLLNYFIRSRFDAKVKGKKTLNELWQDKDLMRKCIDWQFMNEIGTHHANRIFAAMTYNQGFRIVSNLKYNFVYARCKKYAVKNGIFFDSCAGWGGRLLGAYALGMKYIAIDANKQLVNELKSLAAFMNYDAEIYYGDSADKDFVNQTLKGRKIDLAFTCPPYWDEEHYSDDEYQSDIQYKEKTDWYNLFLIPMINNVRNNLSKNGHFIISCNEKIDWSCVNNVEVRLMQLTWKNKMEDDYYFIGNYSEKENEDYVRCAICGECMNHLANHLKKAHNMTLNEYLNEYSNSFISSNLHKSKRISANQNKFHGQKRTYNKRYVYLLPDGNYASKVDEYKRTWNSNVVCPEHKINASTINYVPKYQKPYEGLENDDFVVCKICGEKRKSLTQHLRKHHHLTKDEYINQYQGEIYSEKAKKAFHLCAENKWKTQFERGDYVKKEVKEKKIIEKEMIEDRLKHGFLLKEIAGELKISDVTLKSYIRKFGIEVPSLTILYIRRAVRNGALFDLEKFNFVQIEKMRKELGKEKLMEMFGVKRTVFDSWIMRLKNIYLFSNKNGE